MVTFITYNLTPGKYYRTMLPKNGLEFQGQPMSHPFLPKL
uniref:Uncharacterized protein n=1 Tax=Anguilla anguilla TaxID=7936 RepID=A0A0E9QE81_ANGAN